MTSAEGLSVETYQVDDALVVQTVEKMDEWIKSSEWITDPDATPAEDKRWEAVGAELGRTDDRRRSRARVLLVRRAVLRARCSGGLLRVRNPGGDGR